MGLLSGPPPRRLSGSGDAIGGLTAAGLDTDGVQRWLDAYVAAWHSYDPDTIRELFTADAVYAYHPWGEPVRGVDAIIADWLDEPDASGSWEAQYAPLMVEGDRAIATGETLYVAEGVRYSNLFVLRFEGERCAEFTEWFMRHPSGG